MTDEEKQTRKTNNMNIIRDIMKQTKLKLQHKKIRCNLCTSLVMTCDLKRQQETETCKKKSNNNI